MEICCRLDAFDGPDDRARHRVLLGRVRDAAAAIVDVPGGLRVTLPAEAAVFVDAAEWITLERRCCRFLEFALGWGEGEPFVMITGPAGAADLVRDAFADA